MPLNNFEIEKMAQVIERYLKTHPNAADTLEGIAKWWLQQQRYNDSMEHVGNALETLIEKGLVEKMTRLDGKRIYSYSNSRGDSSCKYCETKD